MATSGPTVPAPRLQNVVATFEMGTKINLQHLVMLCPFVQYTPKRFAAGVLRLRDPKTTCLVFASGKAVCTGATTEQFAQMASLKFVMLLQRHGAQVAFQNFRIQNIVAAAHCNFRVDLNKLSDTVNGFCSYEPALFPGLMYRVKVPATPGAKPNLVVFIVFQSGKCVVTGGKNRTQICACWDKFFQETLCSYRTQQNNGTSGNYRMCQLSQKRNQDLTQMRAIASIRLDVRQLMLAEAGQIAQSKVRSEQWPGHTWNAECPMELKAMELLEPDLFAQQPQPSAPTRLEDVLTAERTAENRLLQHVLDNSATRLADTMCRQDLSPTDRAELKRLALYAWPQAPTSKRARGTCSD